MTFDEKLELHVENKAVAYTIARSMYEQNIIILIYSYQKAVNTCKVYLHYLLPSINYCKYSPESS